MLTNCAPHYTLNKVTGEVMFHTCDHITNYCTGIAIIEHIFFKLLFITNTNVMQFHLFDGSIRTEIPQG